MRHRKWINHLDKLYIDDRLIRTSMTQDDFELEAIWKCAFPDGLNHDEVLQLIYRMYEIDGEDHPMSMRAVANHVGILLGIRYVVLLHEVYGVKEIVPNQEFQSYLKERLETCGYYEWLTDDGYPIIEAKTIEELLPILVEKRPAKRITLVRESIRANLGKDDSQTINNFLRSALSLPKTWKGITWREFSTTIPKWDDTMRALSQDSNLDRIYLNPKEAHVLVGKIMKVLNDLERLSRGFTNHRGNGTWYSVTDSSWQYWLITMNSTDIGVLGIEE